MEHLNNFNIIAGIQNFTALIKSKEHFLLVQHLKAVKCAVAFILCVALDIEMQSGVSGSSGGRSNGIKTATCGVDSFSRVVASLLALFTASSFISLIFILAFPFFVFVNVFVFQ